MQSEKADKPLNPAIGAMHTLLGRTFPLSGECEPA